VSDEEREQIRLFSFGAPDRIVADNFGIQLKQADVERLLPGGWLSDEVINFYLGLLELYFSRCHFFNTHFYALLDKGGHARVATWTRNVDIFALDMVFVPVHLYESHWALVVVNVQERAIEYYDSLASDADEPTRVITAYLLREELLKRGGASEDWRIVAPGTTIPQQRNGSDCGVFLCRYAYCRAAGLPFDFTADDMPLMRDSMMVEIIRQRLRTALPSQTAPSLLPAREPATEEPAPTPPTPRRRGRPPRLPAAEQEEEETAPADPGRNDKYCCLVCGSTAVETGYVGTSALFCSRTCVDKLLAM
jgi:sentrin-specific protease 1